MTTGAREMLANEVVENAEVLEPEAAQVRIEKLTLDLDISKTGTEERLRRGGRQGRRLPGRHGRGRGGAPRTIARGGRERGQAISNAEGDPGCHAEETFAGAVEHQAAELSGADSEEDVAEYGVEQQAAGQTHGEFKLRHCAE
jgi:hypothetical protein